jgi:SAM-dependent methyltransferase
MKTDNLIKRNLKKMKISGLSNQSNRDMWLKETLKKIPAGFRILDAGAGELQYKKYCTHLNYVAQDFAQYDGIGNNAGLQTVQWDNTKLDIVSDITCIPEADASFDAIMCVEVFEHLPNPIAAIKEFSRLLKETGFLIITAPFCSLTHFAPYHFYSGFNRYFYEKHLIDNGFEILDISPNGNFFEYIAQEIMRIPYCAKKYSKTKISIIDKFFLFRLLTLLSKLSHKGQSSNELLNFGFHILAKKQE